MADALFRSLASLLLAALLAPPSAMAEGAPVGCPPTVATEQHVTVVPKGYAAREDALGPSELTFVTVSDGPPDQHADLVPDVQTAAFARWDLTAAATAGGYYLSCHYARTRFTLSRPIPAAVKQCTVHYRSVSAGLLEGYRSIAAITCN